MSIHPTIDHALAPTLFDRADSNPGPALTVLSWGGGQDSTAILYKLVFDATFRLQYAPNRLLVVMSDTGDEAPDTYAHVEQTKQFCSEHGIEFVFITADMGHHQGDWTSLIGYYRARTAIGSKAFPKTCTDRLKIGPIYSFLEAWLTRNYVLRAWSRKRAFYEFASTYGRIRVLIGLAADERDRIDSAAAGTARAGARKWMLETVDRVYPLAEIGFDRKACQEYIASVGRPVPPPSVCERCPWANDLELLYLWHFRRAKYDEWVDLERAKLDKWAHLGSKNVGVWGKADLPLPAVLERVREKYPEYSANPELLKQYRFSHGHCVRSKY